MKFIFTLGLIVFAANGFAQRVATKNLAQIMQMQRADFVAGDLKEIRKKQARMSIIESEAIRYASQLAFIQRLNMLIDQANLHQAELDEIFDFRSIQQLATEQLANAKQLRSLAILFLPPVLAEYSRVRSSDKTQLFYRNAQTEYQIKQPARLTEQRLDWRFYLTQRPFDQLPELVPGALANNREEQSIWAFAAKKGWQLGRNQANTVMQDRLQQLMLIHKGMLKYVLLVDQNIIKPPQVSLSTNALEISPNKDQIAVNIIRYKIFLPAQFNGDTRQWKSQLYSGELQIRKEALLHVSAN